MVPASLLYVGVGNGVDGDDLSQRTCARSIPRANSEAKDLSLFMDFKNPKKTTILRGLSLLGSSYLNQYPCYTFVLHREKIFMFITQKQRGYAISEQVC